MMSAIKKFAGETTSTFYFTIFFALQKFQQSPFLTIILFDA